MPIQLRARGLLENWLGTISLFLAWCSVALEPAFNETIVSEVEVLTSETELMFESIPNGIPSIGYEFRKEKYAALAARAATIKLYSEARPAPSGRVSGILSNLFSLAIPADVGTASGSNRQTGNVVGDRLEMRRLALWRTTLKPENFS